MLLLNAVTFVSSSSRCPGMRTGELRPAAAGHGRGGGIRDGFHYVRVRRDLLLVMLVVFVVGTFGLNFQITTALMATEVSTRGRASTACSARSWRSAR